MSKINILPAKVYNRIAAGEVVDRPYSVVKELLENAIDAGTTEISVYVEKGGRQLIRVVDNGCGIERDDLQSAFLPHATSKIATAEDLENIITLGFRGEAVASIAAVSKMSITSKIAGGKCYRLSCEGGNMGEIKEVAGDLHSGTDVQVSMLFYNTPVRLGFLKSDKAEETDITTFVSRFILNRPEISFSYYVNDKKVLQSFGGGDDEAMAGVYGAAILNDCYKIDGVRHGIRVRGYIGNQNFYKPNKSYQCVFLNGRYILNATISAAVTGAYSSYLMKRQYPFYVLHIEMPSEIVDVNVHPHKTDVRFADNNTVYGAIYSIISAVLDGSPRGLEYIVQSNFVQDEPITKTEKPNTYVFENEEPVSMETPQSISQFILSYPKEKKENLNKERENSAVFGFPEISYEEAQKEVKACAPVFIEQNSGEMKSIRNLKGFTPIEEIGEFNDSENPVTCNEQGEKRKKRKKNAEKLHEKYPDLYFKKLIFEVNDPEYEKMQDKSGVENTQTASDPDYFMENKRFLEEMDVKAKQDKIDVKTCARVGTLFNTYLLYERGDDVFIIDQHAAHEKLIFERLKEKMRNRTILRQPMLLPYTINLNAFESDFIRERLHDIIEMGFDIQETEEYTFKVYSVPLDLQSIDLKCFFNEILGDVGGYRAIKLEDLLKDKLASAACKAAVKGGMRLTDEEIEALFVMMDGDMRLKCPHGRPVVVKMTKTQLEKMFKRIV